MAMPATVDTPQLIARECRQLVLSQGTAGALANVGVAALFLIAVRNVHPHAPFFGWVMMVLLVSALRIALAAWARRTPLDSANGLPNTPAICIVLGLLSGSLWSAAATLLFPLGHSEIYLIAAFLLIGMPAGAISSFAAWWPAYAAYVLSSTGPFAVYFFLDGRATFNMAGIAICLFDAFLLREGFIIGRTIKRNVAQRIALMAMTRSLGDAVDRADAANRAKSTFLTNMSHELRTPLNAIIGMSRLLADAPDAPQHRVLPNNIHQAGQSLLALINDVLDLSQIEAGRVSLHLAAFDPCKSIASVVSIFEVEAASKSLQLHLMCSATVPQRFVTDPVRLQQVLINLVSNAIKFTEVGCVRIEVQMENEVVGNDHGRRVLCIDVIDTGPGMSEYQQTLVFLPFHQADAYSMRAHSGSGLGLKISRDLVTLMGGDIDVSSEPGIGSRFRVMVPELAAIIPHSADDAEAGSVAGADADAGHAPQAGQAGASSNAGLRVLVVEDNELNATLVKLMLERDGCEVEWANSGDAALALMLAASWDIVLMDCQMPDLDGYSATRRWREIEAAEQRPRLPILALTAHAMAEDRGKCINAGMDDYLTKPVKLENLRDALSRLVGNSAAAMPNDSSLP